MKKTAFILLILIFLLSPTAFAASDDLQPGNGTISMGKVSNGQYSVNKEALFTEKYGPDWIVSMDSDLNLPKRMVGSSIELAGVREDGTEPQVRQFIADNTQVLGFNPSEMKLIKEDHDSPLYAKGDGITNIVYQQSYKGIPVYSSKIGVTVSDGNIVSMNSNYFPDITAPNEPTIDEVQTLSAIASDLGIDVSTPVAPLVSISMEELSKQSDLKVETIKAKDISLVIYPLEKGNTYEYHLAYKVELNTIMEPLSAWVYFVDATDGQILYRYDRITPYTIEGNVTGSIYPEYPSQTPINVSFWNQTISVIEGSDYAIYSGRGDNLWIDIKTFEPLNLTSAVNSTFNFSTRYDIESGYDYAYATISKNTSSFEIIKSYTGIQSSWTDESLDISGYDGENVWIGFVYVTDDYSNGEGFYADNITVSSENGLVFSDDLDENGENWNNTGFSLKKIGVRPITITNNDGYYNISGLLENTTLYSELNGSYVKVINEDQEDTCLEFDLTTPTYNWNWFDIDTSDRREESNVFYHVNVIHDYFTRCEPFDIHSMDYQTIATVEYGSESGNAFSDDTDIYLYGGNEYYESTALLSDVIYHEYTHSVVAHVYTTDLPYINESGALNEGWADYFACTINNNTLVGEGFYVGNTNGLRDLNTTYRYPEDITGEVHDDSRIISGAMWDMRNLLGAELSDELVIRAMKLEPQNFQEYLEDILIVDDDNSNLNDGTPHLNEICTAFYVNHGVYTELFDHEVSGAYPANGSCTSNNTTAIGVNITGIIDINLSSINMKVNGNPVITTKTEISNGYGVENITYVPYDDGTVTVWLNASDNSGNLIEYNWSFFVDNSTPTIAIISPAEGYSTYSESVTISGIANGTGSPAFVTVNGIETSFEGANGTFIETVDLSVGTNTIYANVTDSAGYTNTTSITVTRNTPAAKTTSSGGGGGGGSTGEAYGNIQMKEVVSQFIGRGEVSYEFKEAVNAIDFINFESLKNSGEIFVTIEVLMDRSTMVDEDPEGEVYRHVNIWVGKAGFATEQNIVDPVVGFRVNKSWINDYNIDESTIILNRYHESEWNQLTTTKVGEDGEYTYFEAKTPGFSPFAISGMEGEVPIVENEIAIIPSSTIEDKNSTGNTDVSSEKRTDVPTFLSKFVFGGGALLLLRGYFKRKSLP